MTPEDIAKVCHEVNAEFCVAFGDFSQPLWENAPDWQKDSAINGVNFHLENPDAGASHSHDCWMKEKLDNGWVYGDKKDPDNKTHPCIMDFELLPHAQKAKDFIFKQIVHSLKGELK